LKLRLEQHRKGLVESTKYRRLLKSIYYEACLNQSDATRREKYFKTHYGKMFLKKRLKSYFTGLTGKLDANSQVEQICPIINIMLNRKYK